MANKKRMYGSIKVPKYKHRTLKDDGDIQGKPNDFIDARTAYVPEEELRLKAIREKFTGKRLYREEDIEALMIENEMLRETLYAQQNHEYARIIQSIITKTGHSTSQIIQCAQKITTLSHQTITEQMAFRMVYSCIDSHYRISFENRPPNTSKLQYAWKIGALPLVSMHMNLLMETVTSMFSLDYAGARKYFAGVSKANAAKLNVKKP
jgi:hypothetical protein